MTGSEQDSAQIDALDDFKGLLDWPKLNGWLEATSDVPGSGPAQAVKRLRGGIQNQVFLIDRDGAQIVLRRPGPNPKDRQNDTMVREARILKALGPTAVPTPQFYALCEDVSVTGAMFYIMEPLEGLLPAGDLPGDYGTDANWRATMGPELVRAAAALAKVDPASVGLGDLGKAENWYERQVSRWRTQLEGYAATPGYDPNDLPHLDSVGAWLMDNLPTNRQLGIIHGDLQFANVMFSAKAPKVNGVIDWELASLGDPMLDLGWILTSWLEPGDPDGRNPQVKPWQDFGPRADLVKLYGELTGRDMGEVTWFFVLACFKLACLLEGTTAAWKGGKVPDNVGQSVHAYASWLMNEAAQIIAG